MFLTTLFKYDVNGFTLPNYIVYLGYAKSLLNFNYSILFPAISAFAYSFLYPFLRNQIEIADVWFKRNANNRKLEISKSSKITIEKYMKLREIYEERSKTLEKVLEKESETIEKNEQLINELSLLKKENNEIRTSLSENTEERNNLYNEITLLRGNLDSEKIKLKKYQDKEEAEKNNFNVKFLNGKWIIREINAISRKTVEFKASIKDGKVYRMNTDGIAIEWFSISKYTLNEVTNNIEIEAIDFISNSNTKLIFTFNNDLSILNGIRTDSEYIKYTFIRQNN